MAITSNRFGVGAGLGLMWMVAPPEPGEPLDRDEALNLLAALTLVTGATREETENAVRALRDGPDAGAVPAAERALERQRRSENRREAEAARAEERARTEGPG